MLTQQGRPLCRWPEERVLLGKGCLAPFAHEGDAVLGQGPGCTHGVSPQWLASHRAKCGQEESPEGPALGGGQGLSSHHLGEEGEGYVLAPLVPRHPAVCLPDRDLGDSP